MVTIPPNMKTKRLAAASAACLAACALASTRAQAQTTSESGSVPTGTLSSSRSLVRVGTNPVLNWSITYPSIVQNYVSITGFATVVPKENLICDIRILGAGVTSKSSTGSIIFVRTAGLMRMNGESTWSTIFDGKNTDGIVQAQGIVKTCTVLNGRPLDFGGRYYWNSSWSTICNSLSGNNVRALVNGDLPPGNVPDYNAPSLESFLRPYLDATGKVRIGPMDVIVFMELTHTDERNIGYDLQDLVFLLTFRKP